MTPAPNTSADAPHRQRHALQKAPSPAPTQKPRALGSDLWGNPAPGPGTLLPQGRLLKSTREQLPGLMSEEEAALEIPWESVRWGHG